MGRTNPTYRDRLASIEREWQSYRRGLRAVDQPRFDRLFEHGRGYAHAASNLNHPTPELPLLVSVVLAHQRRLDEREQRLDALEQRLDEREQRLDALEQRLDEREDRRSDEDAVLD